MKKKILVLGANGMLGGSIFRYLSMAEEFSTYGTVRSQEAKTKLNNQGFRNIIENIDVTNPMSMRNAMRQTAPNIVINCVGIIKQKNNAGSHCDVIEINSLLPHRLASICTELSAQLVHFSTDCVFNGRLGDYKEDSIPDAIDLYGRSKLLGEVVYDKHLTLRTSIIGHEINSRDSLVDWFLSQHDEVKGFANAVFSGLPTISVAKFIHEHVLQGGLSGLYHLSASPIDKYSILKMISECYQFPINLIKTSSFSIDRSLNSEKLFLTTGFKPKTWPQLIKDMNDEYKAYFE
jgi:dTDP-4-dehydrorhamnose reductase